MSRPLLANGQTLWQSRRRRRTLLASASLAGVGDGCRGVAAEARARAIRAGVPRERDRRTGIAEPDGRGSEGSRRQPGRTSPAAPRRYRRAPRRRCAGASEPSRHARQRQPPPQPSPAGGGGKGGGGSRAPAADGDVLRSRRLDRAFRAARSRGSARGHRRVSPRRRRGCRRVRWVCRQVHGRRRPGLFRLPASA